MYKKVINMETTVRRTEYGAYMIIEADIKHQSLFQEIFDSREVMITPTGLGHIFDKEGGEFVSLTLKFIVVDELS